MELNKELLTKAKSAKSLEELIAIAKENGMELTEENAQAYFKLLNPQTGEIADDELDNVSGGGCGSPASKYSIGQNVWFRSTIMYNGVKCNASYYGTIIKQNYNNGSWYYTISSSYTERNQPVVKEFYIREDAIH